MKGAADNWPFLRITFYSLLGNTQCSLPLFPNLRQSDITGGGKAHNCRGKH